MPARPFLPDRLRTAWEAVPRTAALVVLILVLAAVLRLLQTPFGLPYLHHWDEPQIASTALRMMKTGDFNPHFFHYGSLTIYANLAVDVLHFFYLLRAEPIPFSLRPGALDHEAINLDDLRTRYDTGFHWEVSHPSFYLWNRGLTAVLGTASVLLTFALARALAGPAAGLVAAAFLAVQGFHVEQSAVVTADVPMSFLALLAVFFAVRFARRGRRGDLCAALVCCGLAAATKYNGVLSLVAPLAACAMASRGPGPAVTARTWLAVAILPLAAFLAAMPWAVLDLPEFLSQAGYEVYHYAAKGHGVVGTEAGGEHLTLELRRLGSNLGWIASVLSLAGLVVVARRRTGIVVLLFPGVYFLALAATRVAFHRNLVVLYPFLAVALGAAVVALIAALRRFEDRRGWRRRYAVGVVGLLLALWWGTLLAAAAGDGWRVWTSRETRSRAVDAVNALAVSMAGEGTGGAIRVGIAEELRLHALDLKRLEPAWELGPHERLVCAADRYDVLVTGDRYVGLWPGNRAAKVKARRLNATRLPAPERMRIEGRNPASPTRLDGLSQDPVVILYAPRRRGVDLPPTCREPDPSPSLHRRPAHR